MSARILVTTHDYTMTGAPIALFNVLTGLKDRFDITVASHTDGPLRRHYLAEKIEATVVAGLFRNVQVAVQLAASFDAVVGNSMLSFMAIHAAAQAKKPSIWYLHEGLLGNMLLKMYPALPAAFPLAKRIVVPCEFSRQLYAPLRTAPIDIVPYGVRSFDDMPLPIRAGPTKLLQLGTFSPRKAQDVSLAAMRMLKGEGFVLNIVGGIVEADYFRKVIDQFRDLACVKISGEIDMNQSAGVIGDCDMLILSSHDEVTPMVILEAMALGRPVIASAVGGIPEMIEEGRTGFLFKDGDANHLAALIRKLGADPQLRKEVGERGQSFVRSHRALDQSSKLFGEIVAETVATGAT